jgi:hypothetical protein
MTLTYLISKIRKKSGPRVGVVQAEAVAAVAEGEEGCLCENSENSAGVAAARRAAVAAGKGFRSRRPPRSLPLHR